MIIAISQGTDMGDAALKLYDDEWQYQGKWTYQDYLDFPDDGKRYEIIEGVLYMGNAPDIDHQFAVMEIAFQIKAFVNQNHLGYVLTAPFEVHLSEKTRPVQPDVLFIRKERWTGRGAKYFEGAPDMVIEVLSPSSMRTDNFVKFYAYEKARIPEYWIASPKTRSVRVFILNEKQEYALSGEFTADEDIESEILAGLKIKTSSLFNAER